MRFLATIACGALALGLSGPAMARTVTFAHADGTRLYPAQRESGAAWLPDTTRDEELPVVVLLHGLNFGSVLRPWLGDGRIDLRPLLEAETTSGRVRPFVLAAPTQTRDAVRAKTLWSDFDLASFLDDVDGAIAPAHVRRSDIVVVGHSGAGCNPSGGLATVAAGSAMPRALVAIDPCLDEEMAIAFAQVPATVDVWIRWQSLQWSRDAEGFERAFEAAAPAARLASLSMERVDAVPGTDPHQDLMPLVLPDILRELLGR